MSRWWRMLLCLPLWAHAEEFSFDISSYEKKPYEWTGYLEITGEHLELNRDSAFYGLGITDGERPGSMARYRGAAELGALYRFKNSSLHFRGRAEIQDDYFGNQHDTSIHELYYAVLPNDRLSVEVGKRVTKWGKGYAWNPVGFVERARDANDPELTREGFALATADYVRSFDGPLKTLAVTPVILPVSKELNGDFSSNEHINVAGKLYLLYRDTDIDLMFLANGSRSGRVGLDFSRNLKPNLEIHGELAYIDDQRFVTIDPADELATEEADAISGLLGLRYLTTSDVTWIVEYYHNGAGYSDTELERFFQVAKNDPMESPTLFALAQRARQSGFGTPNPGNDYFYVRASRKEPINIVYLTAGIVSIVNLRDGSFSFTPELVYTGIHNTEARLRLTWLQGEENTEFGEKLSGCRIELRLRHFF